MKKLEKYKNWILAFVFIVAILAVYKTFDNFYKVKEFAKTVISSLTPFVVGFVIAYILNIPCGAIDDACKKSKFNFVKKGSKAISITGVYLALVLISYVFVSSIAPKIVANAASFSGQISGFVGQVVSAIENFQTEHGIILFKFDSEGIMAAVEKILGKVDVTRLSNYAITVTASVVKVFVGIIVSVYMLIEKDKIKATTKRILRVFLKEKRSERVLRIVKKVNKIFSKYLFCLLLDAIIMMILATVVLKLLNVKYAFILGIMIGLFNLIPYFGAIIAVTISIVVTLLADGLIKALWVAIALLIVQQLDSNFIGPKIMGDMLDASPLLIILAVTLGGGLFGVVGMIVCVPLFIILKMAFEQFMDAKERRAKRIQEAEESTDSEE